MTSSLRAIFARHEGPYVLVAWIPSPKSKNSLSIKVPYGRQPNGEETIKRAFEALDTGAESVTIWSASEQQFVTSVRKGDAVGAEVLPDETSSPTTKRSGRAGEYIWVPGRDDSPLSESMQEILDWFEVQGAATVADASETLGYTKDVMASRVTRLKNLGFLRKEAEEGTR